MRFLLLLACLTASALPAASQPPVRETVDLSAVTLNRLVLEPFEAPQAGLLPLKTAQLPLSVQLYLRPSGQVNFLTSEVQKAAAQVRKAVAPGAKQKDLLRESPRVAAAVREWLDANLSLDPALDLGSRPSTDHRLAWPKASAILKAGKSDADGRAQAAVALLRALRIPARLAYARGRLTVQYWCALPPRLKAAPKPLGTKGKPAKPNKKAAKEPLGYWALLDEGLHETELDAWSLDPGVPGRVLWKPAQELSVSDLGWQRAVFAQGDSLAAVAAYDATLKLGRLTLTAQAMPQALSVAANEALQSLTRGTQTLWILTVQSWRLQSDGTMAPMTPVELLTPYRPHLASWGRELRGPVRELELEAQGLWSDRPLRPLLRKGSLGHEWASPPPALGVLHWIRFGLQKHSKVLQASRNAESVEGLLLRADNLTPRAGDTVTLGPEGSTSAARAVTVGDDGRFSFALNPEEAVTQVLELRTVGGIVEIQSLSKP